MPRVPVSLAVVSALALIAGSPMRAQPAFEVASVKPVDPAQPRHYGMKIDPARVDIGAWSMKQLIQRAYGLWPYQLSGPEWMATERFDIVAKFPDGSTPGQFSAMLRSLLAERFGLKVHRETKDLPSLVLTVAKGGPKMTAAGPGEEEEQSTADPAEVVGRILDKLFSNDAQFGMTNMSSKNGIFHIEFTKMPMVVLVQVLASYLTTPVIDRTGLTGVYQATLEFSPADTNEAANSAGNPELFGASLFAMAERLGLKLQRMKAPVEILVVDRVNQVPSVE